MQSIAFAPSVVTTAAAEKNSKKTTPDACAVKFRKTELCRYYPKCAKGSDCPYAHSENELRSRPNFTKTRMCAGYKDGRCQLPASDCPFAHGRQDLRPTGEGQQRPALAAAVKSPVRGLKMGLAVPPPPGLSEFADGALTPTASGASTPTSFARSGASTPPVAEPALEVAAIALGPAEIAPWGEELQVVARLRV
mmetsp:Transcript_46020/g.129486  ORF Transcript_46020/g.129486 Transcript_46020/m.129486 type:complete len:194 (+) Transcript_46020:98-679(+)